MKTLGKLMCAAVLLSSCTPTSADTSIQSEVPPSAQTEAGFELLNGLTKTEQDMVHDFREQCPWGTGKRLFFDPSRRIVVIDINYIASSDFAACVKAADGKVVVPDERPTYGVELTSGTVPLLDTSETPIEELQTVVAALQTQRGPGPGDIAYAEIANDAIRIGVRTIPSHCSQVVDMKEGVRDNPASGLSQEAKDIVRKAQAKGIPVSLDHEFIDSSWGTCQNGESCDEPPIGC